MEAFRVPLIVYSFFLGRNHFVSNDSSFSLAKPIEFGTRMSVEPIAEASILAASSRHSSLLPGLFSCFDRFLSR
jgi:hypothetical protein